MGDLIDVVGKGEVFLEGDSKIADWKGVRQRRSEICWKEIGWGG